MPHPLSFNKDQLGVLLYKSTGIKCVGGGGCTELWCLVGIWGPTRASTAGPPCFATLVVCSLVMCFFLTRQSATSNQEHRKKDKLRSKESRKIGKSAQKRADKKRNAYGHLNANRHGRHVAEIWGCVRDKISSGFAVKRTVHPIKKYSIYFQDKNFNKTHVNAPGTGRKWPVRDHANFKI